MADLATVRISRPARMILVALGWHALAAAALLFGAGLWWALLAVPALTISLVTALALIVHRAPATSARSDLRVGSTCAMAGLLLGGLFLAVSLLLFR